MSTTTLSTITPVQLDLTNYHIWFKYILRITKKYPNSGRALNTNVEHIMIAPSTSDLLPDGTTAKYDFTTSGTMTAESKKDYRSDHSIFAAELAKFKNEEALTISDIEPTISINSLIILDGNTDYIAASTLNNSFQMMKAIKAVHIGATSMHVKISRTIQFFNLNQSNFKSFEQMKEALLRGREHLLSDHGSSTYPGCIEVDQLVGCLFLGQAADQEVFKFLIDSTLAANPTGKIPDIDATIQKFQDFSNQKAIAPPALKGDSLMQLSVTTTTDTVPKGTKYSDISWCKECKKEFLTVNGPSGTPYLYCKQCSANYKKKYDRSNNESDIVKAEIALAKLKGEEPPKSMYSITSKQNNPTLTANDVASIFTEMSTKSPYFNNSGNY